MSVDAVQIARVVAFLVLEVAPVVGRVFDATAVAEGDKTFLDVAAAAVGEQPLGVGRSLRYDVDHAVDGVGAPDRASRSADHLDPIDVLEHGVLHVPVDARVERRVDASPVHQDQELVRHQPVETARGDGPAISGHLGHLHARNHTKRVRDGAYAGASNVLGGDHVHRGRSLAQELGLPGDRDDLEAEEVLDVHLQEVVDRDLL